MPTSILSVDVQAQAFDDFNKKFAAFQEALGKMGTHWQAAGRAAASATPAVEAHADAAERVAEATAATAAAQTAAHQQAAAQAARATAAASAQVAAQAAAARSAPRGATAPASAWNGQPQTGGNQTGGSQPGAAPGSARPTPTVHVAGGHATASAVNATGGGVNIVVNVTTPQAAAGAVKAPLTDEEKRKKAWEEQKKKEAAIVAQKKKEDAELEKELAKQDKKAREDAQRSAERLRDTTKGIATFVKDSTTNLLKWVGISSIVGGLLGAGAGLFGLDRLAGSASAQLRGAQGLNTTAGNQQAFALNFGPTVDSSFVGNVADAQNDLSKRWVFGHLGLTQAQQNGDSADLAAATLGSVKTMVDAHEQKGDLKQWADANGITSVLGLQLSDLRRIGAQTRAQLNQETQGYQTDKGTFNLPPDTLAKWQKFEVQLGRAGTTLEDTLINKLVPLTGPLTDLSKSVTDVVTSILGTTGLAGGISWLSDKVEEFAKYLASPQFGTDIHTLEHWIGQFAQAMGRAYNWIAKTLPGLGLPTVPISPLDDGSTTTPGSPGAPGATTTMPAIAEPGGLQSPAITETSLAPPGGDAPDTGSSTDNNQGRPPNMGPSDVWYPNSSPKGESFWGHLWRGWRGTKHPIFNADGSPANADAWVQVWKQNAKPMSLADAHTAEGAAAAKYGVNPAFSAAIYHNEGGLNPDGTPRISATGDIGAGQLQPGTAIDLKANPFDDASNIDGSTRYMRQMLTKYGGDYDKAAAAYNWGETHLDKDIAAHGDNWRGVLPPSVASYVQNVDNQMEGGSSSATALAAAVNNLAATIKAQNKGIQVANNTGGNAIVTAAQVRH